MGKQQEARAVTDAAYVAAHVIIDYGFKSDEATTALQAFDGVLDRAEAAGVTKDDIRNARRNS